MSLGEDAGFEAEHNRYQSELAGQKKAFQDIVTERDSARAELAVREGQGRGRCSDASGAAQAGGGRGESCCGEIDQGIR